MNELVVTQQTCFLLDMKPVPVVGVKPSNRRNDFAGCASYGYCAGRRMKYFGCKLMALTILDSIPVADDLVPAYTDERAAAEVVLTKCDRLPRRTGRLARPRRQEPIRCIYGITRLGLQISPACNGGKVDKLLSLSVADVELTGSEQVHTRDIVTCRLVRRTIGFVLAVHELDDPRPIAVFGHSGVSSSGGIADP
jgi:hypothetical protein